MLKRYQALIYMYMWNLIKMYVELNDIKQTLDQTWIQRVNNFESGNILKSLNMYITIITFAFWCPPHHQWISVPFALSNPAVSDISVTAKEAIYQSPWLGKIEPADIWLWADNFFLLVSQNFHQRIHHETVY